ncbi:hypothetical protein VOLCADRAFT_104325 [Volvox carteri f. nagariensis]|uniref:Uncharacterized protein n=1 Tax=Volvox carteri f. nagariensis TaxID=3068 RepID=D8TSX0_VOLCA|nr:uncharacterized protein VOLCADRAFT_104325 [Volvox carteri f. nagariensis]EFJ49556.1 hypothetical protein VOLCADRAFT_104325 [Volvox carteri f. nagariensis]|eukprot:XP_002949537.1 hypothetical protein VOLCADRAFT_104325 [Volvox carteri f. nagariensis]
MGFLKKFKEQKQDGPDAAPENGPVSTQPSIGPEDFLPPEPVPRTTRSRAKASSAATTPTPEVASPSKGKATARGKSKESQQEPAAEAKPAAVPSAPPKGAKAKAAIQPGQAKAFAMNKAPVNKAGDDAVHRLDTSGAVPSAALAEETVPSSKVLGARSRAANKVAASPRKETRGKGANSQVDTTKGRLSTEASQTVPEILEPKEVQTAAGPLVGQPPHASGSKLEQNDLAGANQQEMEGPNSHPTLAVDIAVPSGFSSREGLAVEQVAVLSEADLPRDPRKRHRAHVPDYPPSSMERPDTAAATTPGASPPVAMPSAATPSVAVAQPRSQLPPQQGVLPQLQQQAQAHSQLTYHPQPQPQQQEHPSPSGQGADTGTELEKTKKELHTPTPQLHAVTAALPTSTGPANGTRAVTVIGPQMLQAEQSSSNPEADGSTLPPPPPLPLPPPLPPHLATSRGQPTATACDGQIPSSRDDANGRSAYVMVGLRESTAAEASKPSGAGGSGGSSSERDRNRDRERSRSDAERTQDRADRDRVERNKDRSRHQPQAGPLAGCGERLRIMVGPASVQGVTYSGCCGTYSSEPDVPTPTSHGSKGGGGRGAAEAHPSSPSRGDRGPDSVHGDSKTAVRSRSRSRDRESKPAADSNVGRDKDRQRDAGSSARSEKDKERAREKEKDWEREKEKLRAREWEKESKNKARGGEAASSKQQEGSTSNSQRNASGPDPSGVGHHKSTNGRGKASGRSRSRSRDAKRPRAEDMQAAENAKEPASGPAATLAAGLGVTRGSGSHASGRDSGSGTTPSSIGGRSGSRGDAVDAQAPSVSVNGAGGGAIEAKGSDPMQQAGRQAESIPVPGDLGGDEAQTGPASSALAAEAASVQTAGPMDGTTAAAGAPNSSRGLKLVNGLVPEAGKSGGHDEGQQLAESPKVPLSPSPRRTYSSSDSEPTRSRSRGYSSSEEEDDAGSAGKRAEQMAGTGGAAGGSGGEGEFDNAENEHEEVLLEYDFDLMEADLMDEHLDEHVRTQDEAAAAPATGNDSSAGNQPTGAGEVVTAEHGAADGEKAQEKEQGHSGRGRTGTASGRVAYEDMGAPGPDLNREEQVAHVTAGLVGQVGEDMLTKLRKLLNDMSALDLSTVRPWALRSLLAINDDEARWRASQALLSIEWSTANNPGGVLHSRLQRAVEMERLALLRSGRAARVKRARSTSPVGAGHAPKRAERSGDANTGRAASPDGRRRRSRSREREAGRGRGGGSKDRGWSTEPREGRDGGSHAKSPDADDERRKDRDRDRTRAASKDREGRDRDREPRDTAPSRVPLREPDLKSRRWDDVMRATVRGCIVKLPRGFVEDARRILYDIDGLDCSQIDANAWDPLLMLPNCEQRLNALRTLRNIRWKERFNVSATVKGTLLRCAEQVQRDMQRRDMMRPGLPLMPLGPPGLMPPAVSVAVGSVGALPGRRDSRYGPPLAAAPGSVSLLGSRVLPPPPPPIPGGTALGMPATRYPAPPEPSRLATTTSRLRDRDRDRDRDGRSKQRTGTSTAAGSRGRSRSKSRSPSRSRRGAVGRRSRSKTRSPAKGRGKAQSRSRSRSRSSRSKSRSRSRGRRNDKIVSARSRGRSRSKSKSRSKSRSRSPADRRGTKRSRSPSQAPANGSGGDGAAGETVPEAGGTDNGGAALRPLSTEFKDRMYKYLKSFGKLDLSGVDDKVFECLGRLPDDSARMDCLRRLSGVQWHAVSGAQETQKRLQALLERGTNELLKGNSAPSKKGYAGSSKRRAGGSGSGRR